MHFNMQIDQQSCRNGAFTCDLFFKAFEFNTVLKQTVCVL